MRIESPSPLIFVRIGWWRRVVWAVVLSVIAGACPLPAGADGPAGNLVQNWSVEQWGSSYGSIGGCPLQVASNWNSFSIQPGKDPARFMKDTAYADCFSSSGAIPRSAEGSYSQNVWLGHTFTAGIYQQIAVTAGKPYTAKSWMLTVLGTSPAVPHTVMVKQVGIDPYGGPTLHQATLSGESRIRPTGISWTSGPRPRPSILPSPCSRALSARMRVIPTGTPASWTPWFSLTLPPCARCLPKPAPRPVSLCAGTTPRPRRTAP